MKKTWIVIVLVAAAALGGYGWWQSQNAKLEADKSEPIMPADVTGTDDTTGAAETPAEEAPAGEATDTVLDQAADAVNDAVDAAAGAVGDAVDGAMDAAEEAATAVGDMASDAATAVGEAAEGALEAAGDMASDAADMATDAAAGMVPMTDLLTVDTFDAAKLVEMVQASDLGEMQKTALVTAIEQAGDSPELVQSVIDQIKQAMGL